MSDHTEETAPVQEQLPTSISVRIHSINTDGPQLAYASVNLNGCFVIRGVMVVQGKSEPFVSMPRRQEGHKFKDICYPLTKEFRAQLQSAVLGAYQQEMAQLTQRGQAAPDQAPPTAQEPQEAPFPQQTPQQTM